MWLYKGKQINSIEDLPEGTFGFVYRTRYIPTDQCYIGKKQLIYNLKKKLGKKEKALWEGKGRPPVYKRVEKESDWKTYYGSHAEVKKLLKEGGEIKFIREILELAFEKKRLTYLENKYLFTLGVLESKKYFNDNIEGRYFKKDFTENLDT
tara:strand:+ start:386 stop:838 length:453 start_codon:yes stop_codon:yes gene_type:complete